MPSKGFTVNTADRNDVISFYQAVFKASEGFENRPMWNYAPDFAAPYSYTYNASVEPPILKNTSDNTKLASGQTSLSFVKDVERRVNFYRALAGVNASVSLMDNDTTRNSSTIQPALSPNAPYAPTHPAYEPPTTTTKAEAVQHSAYLISRSYLEKTAYASYAVNHKQELTASSVPIINHMVGWNKMTWNAHRHSNISRGFYGPRAIDKYISEDIPGTSSTGDAAENINVGHRRKVLLTTATNFATGDMPPEYVEPRPVPQQPVLREATNALYHLHRPEELATVAPTFVSYPNAGFFPAPLNTPFWSLMRVGASFTNASVTITDSQGKSVGISDVMISTTPEPAISWRITDANAIATDITSDRTFNVTVSNFTISGAAAPPHSYSVTLVNPDLITSPQTLTGAAQPPASGSAGYLLTPPSGSEAIQVNTFQASSAGWPENAEVPASSKIIGKTYGNYEFNSPMTFTPGSGTSIPAIQGSRSFRLTHPVRYDAAANGIPHEILELGREILPSPTLTSNLQFSYRRGLMTTSSTMVVEISSNEGASWTTLGTPIVGHLTGSGSPEGSNRSWSQAFPASTVPYLVRFRLYKSGTGSTYNHSDSTTANAATGIFLDNITTTNCTWLDLKKTNEVAASTTKFVLDNSTAGVALTAGSSLQLRTRAKLGGNWFQYGPSKIVTPTSSPATGFAGWAAYEYPELTGGIGGDHNGDGVANAVAFAFHQNPTQANKSTDTIIRSADTISIERSIPSQRAGLTYKAEWSDTLLPNSWSQANVTVTFPSGKVVATAPAGPAGKRFIRWKFDE